MDSDQRPTEIATSTLINLDNINDTSANLAPDGSYTFNILDDNETSLVTDFFNNKDRIDRGDEEEDELLRKKVAMVIKSIVDENEDEFQDEDFIEPSLSERQSMDSHRVIEEERLRNVQSKFIQTSSVIMDSNSTPNSKRSHKQILKGSPSETLSNKYEKSFHSIDNRAMDRNMYNTDPAKEKRNAVYNSEQAGVSDNDDLLSGLKQPLIDGIVEDLSGLRYQFSDLRSSEWKSVIEYDSNMQISNGHYKPDNIRTSEWKSAMEDQGIPPSSSQMTGDPRPEEAPNPSTNIYTSQVIQQPSGEDEEMEYFSVNESSNNA